MKAALLLALVLVPAVSQAQVYRCTASGGAVTYQETPCPESAPGGTMNIPSQYPEVNQAERNRLMAREAALDARMLEREKIESAERVARAELAAREREAQAAREAALAAQQQSYAPVWGYWGGYRPPHVIHHRHYQVRSGPPLR